MRPRITTQIKREFLSQIVSGEKKTEYREIKPYWTKRFESISVPFELCLMNGMPKGGSAPEVLALIDKIAKFPQARDYFKKGHYSLRISRILRVSNWDKRKRCPA